MAVEIEISSGGGIQRFWLEVGQTFFAPNGDRVTLVNAGGYAPSSSGEMTRIAAALERLADQSFQINSFAEQIGYWKAKAELLERSHEALSQKLATFNAVNQGGTEGS